MYRVHEPPSREKLVALKDYLKTFGIDFALGQVIKPARSTASSSGSATPRAARRSWSNRCARRCRRVTRPSGSAFRAGARDLRAFHLADPPLRRPVGASRSVSAYKLGDGGLPSGEEERFEQIGEQISMLERRAMEAERETVDRYVAGLPRRPGRPAGRMPDHGVQPFGFFARGQGPRRRRSRCSRRTSGQEYFRYDEAAKALVGDESGETTASASG